MPQDLSDEMIKETYEFGKEEFKKRGIDIEKLKESLKEQKLIEDKFNKSIWDNNRPSKYETWKMIAKVIANGDIKYYRPKLKPNTHWSNYPESGSL